MKHLHMQRLGLWLAAAVLLGLVAGQSAAYARGPLEASAGPSRAATQNSVLDPGICNPDAGPFSLDITNPYLPYTPGQIFVLKGVENGVQQRLRISVLDATEKVAGVTTRVVEERFWDDGQLAEVAWNFFAQAPDGTVCYFGEDVNYYENGRVVSHDGSWRAGKGNNLPGIAMPAHPAVGMTFAQERAPGIAEDQAEIVAIGKRARVPAGSYPNTLRLRETNPLDPGPADIKLYAPGVGLIKDEVLELVATKDDGDVDDD